MRFRPGGPLLVLAVTAAVGFLLASQLGGSERFSQRLSAESEGDLARILSSLTTEADSLRDEISNLKLQLLSLETSSQQDDAAEDAAEQQLAALAVLAATVPVTGPGVEVTITDPEDSVGYDTMIDIVQELRDAGAEAVAINQRRVGPTSSFGERSGEVTLDGEVLTRPYVVRAIGAPATIEGALKIPGGVTDTLRSLDGVAADVVRRAKVDLPSLSRTPTFRVARPVGSGS